MRWRKKRGGKASSSRHSTLNAPGLDPARIGGTPHEPQTRPRPRAGGALLAGTCCLVRNQRWSPGEWTTGASPDHLSGGGKKGTHRLPSRYVATRRSIRRRPKRRCKWNVGATTTNPPRARRRPERHGGRQLPPIGRRRRACSMTSSGAALIAGRPPLREKVKRKEERPSNCVRAGPTSSKALHQSSGTRHPAVPNRAVL